MNGSFFRAKIMIRNLFISLFLMSVTTAVSASQNSMQTSEIKRMLIDEALVNGLSPSLILAIAKVESDFNPVALSHAGAKGVMQIMPATAQGEFGVSSEALYDPQTNISVGVRFIKHLLEKYDDQVDIALSHYNGGSAVRRSNGTTRVIPSTQAYVTKVKKYAFSYQQAGYDRAHHGQDIAFNQREPVVGLDDFGVLSRKQNNFTKVTYQKIEQDSSDSRIETLQKLQMHNLTRERGVQVIAPRQSQVLGTEHHTRSNADKLSLIQGWERIFN